MSDLVSVIIPIYKVEKYLDECILSVANQTYENLEIILVDDGSPDNCPKICDEWAEKDSRIKVIHKENGGLSDARNAGIDIASGDYIAFADSDDTVAPEMYERLLELLKKANADISACGIKAVYDGRTENVKIKPEEGGPEKILAMLYDDTVFPVSAWNKLYRRELWEDIRFPLGKICEDAFTTCFLVDRAKKIIQTDEPFYFYRIRENSTMTSAFSLKRMDEEEAWRVNYEFMGEKYPELKTKAFDFYLQKVNVLIHTMTEKDRKTYKEQFQKLRGILRINFGYILFGSRLGIKQRIKLALDIINL